MTRDVLANAIVALLYAALGSAVHVYFAAYGVTPAPLWPPAGVSIAAALIGGWRWAPGLLLGSAFIQIYMVGLRHPLLLGLSIISALAPMVAASMVRAVGVHQSPLRRFSDVVWFVVLGVGGFAVLLATAATAVLLAANMIEFENSFATWSRWLVGDAGGALLLAPAILSWWYIDPVESERQQRAVTAAVGSATLLAGALLFWGRWAAQVSPALPFLLIAPLLWLAVRASARTTFTVFAALCVIALSGTAAGYGPLASAAIGNPMTGVSMMIFGLGVSVLLLAALERERRDARLALQQFNAQLEQRVTERTAALETISTELQRIAATDALTGLPNRRSFWQSGADALARARAERRAVAIAVIDVDWFKQVNDRHGHDAGDQALRLTGAILARHVRAGDLVARIGGEEFAVLFYGTGLDEACRVAERCRAALADQALDLADVGAVRLTLSAGVACCEATKIEDLDRLIARADRALYQAKSAGRNRIEADSAV